MRKELCCMYVYFSVTNSTSPTICSIVRICNKYLLTYNAVHFYLCFADIPKHFPSYFGHFLGYGRCDYNISTRHIRSNGTLVQIPSGENCWLNFAHQNYHNYKRHKNKTQLFCFSSNSFI